MPSRVVRAVVGAVAAGAVVVADVVVRRIVGRLGGRAARGDAADLAGKADANVIARRVAHQAHADRAAPASYRQHLRRGAHASTGRPDRAMALGGSELLGRRAGGG